jgi:hypothetical protein
MSHYSSHFHHSAPNLYYHHLVAGQLAISSVLPCLCILTSKLTNFETYSNHSSLFHVSFRVCFYRSYNLAWLAPSISIPSVTETPNLKPPRAKPTMPLLLPGHQQPDMQQQGLSAQSPAAKQHRHEGRLCLLNLPSDLDSHGLMGNHLPK